MNPYVYGLVDPAEPNHIRYVGMSIDDPLRPYHHARTAYSCDRRTHLVNWILKLHDEGRAYEVLILQELAETTCRSFVGFVESCYIKSLREIGHDLTNCAPGGYGGDGPWNHTVQRSITLSRAWTPERRAERSRLNKEMHAAGEFNRPKKWTEERRARVEATWAEKRRGK